MLYSFFFSRIVSIKLYFKSKAWVWSNSQASFKSIKCYHLPSWPLSISQTFLHYHNIRSWCWFNFSTLSLRLWPNVILSTDPWFSRLSPRSSQYHYPCLLMRRSSIFSILNWKRKLSTNLFAWESVTKLGPWRRRRPQKQNTSHSLSLLPSFFLSRNGPFPEASTEAVVGTESRFTNSAVVSFHKPLFQWMQKEKKKKGYS